MARPTTAAFSELFGGLNLESGTELDNLEARELTNLYIRNKGQELQRRKGQALVASGYATGSVDGLKWVRIDGTDYIFSVLGTVYSSGVAVSGGTSRFTAGNDVNFCKISNKLYFGNGVDQNCRFDGGSVAQVMPSVPSVTGISGGTGAGTTHFTAGTYTYKITFVSVDGIDSQPSAEFNVFTSTNYERLTFSGIPTAPAAENVTARHIWRTFNEGTDFYLVGTVSGNVTTTFIDETPDSDIDTTLALDTSTVRFPPCRYLVNFQERLAGAHCESSEGDKHTLYVSNYQIPEDCPLVAPLDQVDDPTFGIRVPLPDDITALVAWGNVLLVWLRGVCYRLIGDNPNNWSLDKWIDVGCVAHRSFGSYRNALMWLGQDGVYLAQSWGQVERISEPIRTVFEGLTADEMASAHGFVWDDRYYLIIAGVGYWFDLKFKVWGKVTPWEYDTSTVSENTGNFRESIYGSVSGSEAINQMETGTDDLGESIAVVWESKDRDLGLFGREKRVHRVVVHFKAGSGTATVELYRGGELLDTFTQDISEVPRTGSEISELDERASEGARDQFFRMRITADATGDDWRLLRAGVHYTLAT